MANLSNIGEIKLIQKIRKLVGSPHGNLEVGPGDDAAVFSSPPSKTIATTDMLIEGIHFDFKIATPFEIGWRAMAANLSDIAAMGGWPLYALVGLAAKPETSAGKIISIYKGMMKLAKRFNCQIAGGDTVSTSGPLILSLTVIGSPLAKEIYLRSSAKPGDRILVTGWLGKSALALREGKLIRLMPRLEEIKYLSRRIKINALIDLSDGLSSDLLRILEGSKAGALLFEQSLPIAPAILKRIFKPHDKLALALNGGEDFELLLTTPEKKIEALGRDFRKKFKIPLSYIGEIKPKNYGLKIKDTAGREKILKASGYQHFKS